MQKSKGMLWAQTAKILEAKPDDSTILVCLVQPGTTLISVYGLPLYFSAEAVATLLPLVASRQLMFAGHKDRDKRNPVTDLVSWVTAGSAKITQEGEYEGVVAGSLVASIEFSNNPLTSFLREDLKKNSNVLQLSIDSFGNFVEKEIDGQIYAYVTAFENHFSVDWVDYAAAGGKVILATEDLTQIKSESETLFNLAKEELRAGIDILITAQATEFNKTLQDLIDRETLYNLGYMMMDLLYSARWFFEETPEKVKEVIENMKLEVLQILNRINFPKLIGLPNAEATASEEIIMNLEEVLAFLRSMKATERDECSKEFTDEIRASQELETVTKKMEALAEELKTRNSELAEVQAQVEADKKEKVRRVEVEAFLTEKNRTVGSKTFAVLMDMADNTACEVFLAEIGAGSTPTIIDPSLPISASEDNGKSKSAFEVAKANMVGSDKKGD